MTPRYAELDARTNFCFLEGASHPGELVVQAKALGMAALGVADRNSLAGVVRAHAEARRQGFRFLPGCRLQFTCGAELIVYPRDRAAYGRLCKLLSIGKSEITDLEDSLLDPLQGDAPDDESGKAKPIPKGECRLAFEQAAELGAGLIGLAVAPDQIDDAFEARLAAWARAWPDRLYLAAAPLHRGDDRARLGRLAAMGERAGAPMIATGLVLYHHPQRRRLQDVLTCIREGGAIDEAGGRLKANAERFLKTPEEMARLFQGHEDALARTLEVVDACSFSLTDLKYEYPDEPVPPGKTPQQHLEDLVAEGVRQKWPHGPPPKIAATISKELRLIAKVKYAEYFLTVHDIVAWARRQPDPILCQGRGSAANSVVCYCLGITSVDPEAQDVLFERFISEERSEPPDIDVDFEHERREQVIQYVYDRYGRHRAAICATVICYRKRSAIRDVGKALGLTEDVTSALANTVWGSWGDGLKDEHVKAVGLRPEDGRLTLALELTRELMGFPRHLSQHVGGFVLTQAPLVETVPVGNAAMPDRTFIEWDKDDIDALGIMKVDVLALGMLTCIRKCFDLIAEHKGERYELADIKSKDDDEVYQMLQKGESLGVFQVESRAQMNMLPRLKPRTFYDLVIEVAIVRPGPIQGDMVHPYLRRRNGIEKENYPAPSPDCGDPDELYKVLHKTLGVPLFQEQAMRIAIEAAGFTSEEANGLRRAMATFRNVGTIGNFEEKMVGNMIRRGYDPQFAKNCFEQIKGFGSYGFPESHAASFAQLVYVSSWLKYWHPDAFCCGLLNSQPMGFYAPAQIVGDARKNGVKVREIDVSHSFAQNTLEEKCGKYCAVRLGFRQIDGFSWKDADEERLKRVQRSFRDSAPVPSFRSVATATNPESISERARGLMDSGFAPRGAPRIDSGEELDDWADRIVAARNRRPFTSLEDFARDTALPKRALVLLADADAFRSLGLDRRAALWAVRRLPDDVPLPLFETAAAREQPDEQAKPLPSMPLPEHVVADYQTIRLSLKGHPMEFLRARFTREGVIACSSVSDARDRQHVRCAGVVLVRQRPGSAKGVVFMTLEDETGIANIVVWPKVMERFRKEVMGSRLILVEGTIQSSPEKVVHLVAERLFDRSSDLLDLANDAPRKHTVPAAATVVEPLNDDRREHPDNPAQKIRHPRNVRILPPSRDFH